MLSDGVIIASALIYMGVLFGIAYYGDQRADAGRSIIANPYIYTLSLAIYCTAWTFYGSVGLAATSGVDFLPIYLGPTLMAVLFWLVLRRIDQGSMSPSSRRLAGTMPSPFLMAAKGVFGRSSPEW